jgi:hypothetical protein
VREDTRPVQSGNGRRVFLRQWRFEFLCLGFGQFVPAVLDADNSVFGNADHGGELGLGLSNYLPELGDQSACVFTCFHRVRQLLYECNANYNKTAACYSNCILGTFNTTPCKVSRRLFRQRRMKQKQRREKTKEKSHMIDNIPSPQANLTATGQPRTASQRGVLRPGPH